jgi:hypothetical protein
MTDSSKPSVILLFGDDELALQERLTDFIGRMAEAGNAEINLARFSASRLDLEAFETQLRAAPFLAPRRMVVLDLGTLTARRLDFPERFFRLLETMPSTSVLVALERVDDQVLERRTRGASRGDLGQAHAEASPFYRWVRDHAGLAIARELRTPRGAAFERWAIDQARKHGAEMDGEAAAGMDPRQCARCRTCWPRRIPATSSRWSSVSSGYCCWHAKPLTADSRRDRC